MADPEIRKANCMLSQLYTSLKNQLGHNYFKSTLDKLNNINHQVPTTNFLQLINSQLIGDTILHLAAKRNLFTYVDLIINRGADLTVKNNQALTAVHQAIHQSIPLSTISNNKLISCILDSHVQQNICANPRDIHGISHFHAACMTNNTKAVEYFLNNGLAVDQSIDVNSTILPGYTPLHIAVSLCALETTELLLKYGANVLIKDAKGMTPLEVLLEQKLKIHESMISKNEAKLCLQQRHRKYCRHKQIVKDSVLKSTEDDLEVIDRIAHLFLQYYFKCREFDNTGDHFSMYLNIACTMIDSSPLELMLKEVENTIPCVSKKTMTFHGYTALHFAAFFNIKNVKLLLKKGANFEIEDFNAPFDICMEKYPIEEIHSIMSLIPTWRNVLMTDNQTRLLDLIYAMRQVDHFNSFLNNIVNPEKFCVPDNSPLWPGYTLLHVSVTLSRRVKSLCCPSVLGEKYMQLVKDSLDDKGIAIATQAANGLTPVHLAFRLNIDVIDLLLQNHQTSENPIDKDGLTHLHIATLIGDRKLTEKLLSNGSNVNAAVIRTIKYDDNRNTSMHNDKSSIAFVNAGSTPLHNAVINGHSEIAKLLLKHGADPYAKDIYDATPIHYEILSPISHIKGNSILTSLPDLKDSITIGGLSHLHVASHVRNTEAIDKLLNQGSDINAKLSLQQPDTRFSRYQDFSALHFALLNVTTLLLKRGADILATTKDQRSTLLYDALNGKRGYPAIFIDALKKDVATQNRMEKDSGVSMLHVACHAMDPVLVRNLLGDGVDVNKLVNFESSIWPGCSPLHCLMNACNKAMFGGGFYSRFCGILRLLLDSGADVTLQNAEMDTPLHLAFGLLRENRGKLDISTMMRAQQDFSINPSNHIGISHFHIACCMHDSTIVKQFLDCDQSLDVNDPIDYFCDEFAGWTPLHLAASNLIKQTSYTSSQEKTIKLLLECGSDIDAEDAWGNTPLHVLAKNDLSTVASMRIIIKEANVKVTNILGETPLEILLKSNSFKNEEIELLLTHGCQPNSFNAFREEGYIAMTISKRHREIFKKTLLDGMTKRPDRISVDEDGRTAIHNFVSTGSPLISDIDFLDFFEMLSTKSCNIDSQDKMGKTALHMAVRFRNYEAVAGLLKSGADPNVLDNNGKLALAYAFEPSELANDSEDYNYSGIIMRTLVIHVLRLQLSGLDVHPLNESLTIEALEKCALDVNIDSVEDYFYRDLEKSKSVTFGSNNLSLYHFLSETGAVASYPTMTFVERKELSEFFESSHKYKLYREYIDLACVLKFQYRKALVRLSLVEPATESLCNATRIDLPKLCCEAVLRFLKNLDLVNLIAAMS